MDVLASYDIFPTVLPYSVSQNAGQAAPCLSGPILPVK